MLITIGSFSSHSGEVCVKERGGNKRSKDDGKQFVRICSKDDEIEETGSTICNNKRRLTLFLIYS
jgi:hypothetical protein